ncbi:MAG TPA: PQQ-dependent sugar dehydrogenase [Actinomycetota bacterium]|nr:PQQ-dependent sugar dehydrogenase [Actinomycetota bacterium]
MRRRIVVIIGTCLVAQLALAAGGAVAGARIRAREVVGGLNQPVAFTFGPGRKIWYAEKSTGQVRVHDLDTGADRAFVTVPGVNGDGERGMLGIALHPRYPAKPLVYVYATRSAGGQLRNQILRYRDDDGTGVGRKVLFTSVAGGSPYHNGGRIAFGPDGMLYAIVGDAHDAANAQDTTDEDRGKIIRIEPDGDVPSDNPFDDRVWVFGIRNSFGFAFDPQTDDLWETENGPACNDEINRIRGGENYGWGPNETCKGASPGNTNQDGPNPVLPELFYENTIGITGIAFCEACRLGGRSDGTAFVGAVNNGEVTRIVFNEQRTGIVGHPVVYDHGGSTLSYEVGPGGRIFFSDFDGINKLVRVGPSQPRDRGVRSRP